MQKLNMAEDVFDKLEKGKNVTIRKGNRNITIGDLLFESVEKKRQEIVDVYMVYKAKLKNVMPDDIDNDGFKDQNDMIEKIKRFYPDINEESDLTIIRFNRKNKK